jgi:broad specificity phosphatase PhoE
VKIYLVRHGETNYNLNKLCNDDPRVDVHLTENGINQVNKTANKLKSVNVDCIFASELNRTQQTADIINHYHQANIIIDKRLNDVQTGYEGKSYELYHEALRKYKDQWSVRLNGGESFEDVSRRVHAFITDLKHFKYDSYVVVTSSLIIRMFYGIVENFDNKEHWNFLIEQVKPASCLKVDLN